MPVQLVQQQYLPPNATVEYATLAHNIDPVLVHQPQFVQPAPQIITSTVPQLISVPTQIIPTNTVTLNTATVLRGNQPTAMQPSSMFGQQAVRPFSNQTIQLQPQQMIGANAYITQQPTNLPQGQTVLPGGQTIAGQPMYTANQPMQPGQTMMTTAQPAQQLGKFGSESLVQGATGSAHFRTQKTNERDSKILTV